MTAGKTRPKQAFPPSGASLMSDTSTVNHGENTGSAPVVLTVKRPPKSGNILPARHGLEAVFFGICPRRRPPFLTVRRNQPDRQPGLIQNIGHAPFRRGLLQTAQERIFFAELRQPPLQVRIECVNTGFLLTLVEVDNRFLFILRRLSHKIPPSLCFFPPCGYTSLLQNNFPFPNGDGGKNRDTIPRLRRHPASLPGTAPGVSLFHPPSGQ